MKNNSFIKTLKRLLKDLSQYKLSIIIASIVGILGSLILIISPSKLQLLTDEIALGLKPNEKNIKLVINKINNNIKSIDFMELLADNTLSEEDRFLVVEALKNPKLLSKYDFSDNLINKMFKPITIIGVKVTATDQYKALKSFKKNELKSFDSLPKSIRKLVYPVMNITKIKNIFLYLIIFYLLSSLLNLINSFIMNDITNNFAKDLRKRVITKINSLPLSFFDTHQTGDVLSRITNDVDLIATSLGESLSTVFSSIILLVGTLIMMFISNWIMALTAILSSVVGIGFLMFLVYKSQKYVVATQEALGKLNSHIEEMYSGFVVVKTSNGQKESVEKFDKLNTELTTVNKKSKILTGLMPPAMIFVNNFGYVAVSVVGAYLVSKSLISFGVIIAFMTYVGLFSMPLSQIGQIIGRLQLATAASTRVFEFLDEEEMTREEDLKTRLGVKDASVSFEKVKFGYSKDKIIIDDFSAEVKSGQKIAIVGPTGAGKTTLVNLLMKFYEIDDGDIKIGGVSIKDIKREEVHKLFTMVLQDTWHFEGSIRDNIAFNTCASEEDVMRALDIVGLSHYVKTLPKGIDTIISDSESLSAGQKQLMTIARAALEDSMLVILDEATSNVDTRTEELVQEAMDKLMKGKTSFIIAHRLSTIKNADLILVLDNGNIVEQGKHEELLKKNGFYAKMYNSQFELN